MKYRDDKLTYGATSQDNGYPWWWSVVKEGDVKEVFEIVVICFLSVCCLSVHEYIHIASMQCELYAEFVYFLNFYFNEDLHKIEKENKWGNLRAMCSFFRQVPSFFQLPKPLQFSSIFHTPVWGSCVLEDCWGQNQHLLCHSSVLTSYDCSGTFDLWPFLPFKTFS